MTTARVILILSAIAVFPCLAPAKRSEPPKVDPVIHEGIRYVTPNDDGRRAYIEAWDIQTNRKLWNLTIFKNTIDPRLEEDVQWVFIKALNVEDNLLLVTSESGRRYQVDLKAHTIKESVPGLAQASRAIAQHDAIPEAVKRAITKGLLAKDYDVSFLVKPFYLSGDFNGDRTIDVTVLVKQRSAGKLGIAIIHGRTGRVTILGAGTAIGNGGDDFEWMDTWELYSRGRVANPKHVPKLHSDALLVSKSEAASALIYWNGKRYVWLQQGD
jgi:hypothetical protein